MKKSIVLLLFVVCAATASLSMAQDAALVQAARKEGKVVWAYLAGAAVVHCHLSLF